MNIPEGDQWPVTLVRGDDWEGLYFQGRLLREGHSLSPEDVLELLGHRVKVVQAHSNWLHHASRLPPELDKVQVEHDGRTTERSAEECAPSNGGADGAAAGGLRGFSLHPWRAPGDA